jgi:hypothetical protein
MEIDVALIGNTPVRKISERWGIPKSSIARHAAQHLRGPTTVNRETGRLAIAAQEALGQAGQLPQSDIETGRSWLPWLRMKGETPEAYAAFEARLSLPADATNQQVADKIGKSRTLVKVWAARKRPGPDGRLWTWEDRYRERENTYAHADEARRILEHQEARRNRRALGKKMTRIADERFGTLNPAKLSAEEARRYAETGSEMEIAATSPVEAPSGQVVLTGGRHLSYQQFYREIVCSVYSGLEPEQPAPQLLKREDES